MEFNPYQPPAQPLPLPEASPLARPYRWLNRIYAALAIAATALLILDGRSVWYDADGLRALLYFHAPVLAFIATCYARGRALVACYGAYALFYAWLLYVLFARYPDVDPVGLFITAINTAGLFWGWQQASRRGAFYRTVPA
ncbi:hypothetical protein [Lysobacter niastensis]|uniref:DUF2069 domain-containing protein n=1 Tax=Lysobacter niastensis TaxID=380629 RepID=A0ABS0BAB1_9GAMM|nr:hypothetical protein [Lysobacter niastensis]MBF6025218.1 hypothetical protein [Lysobacter niastensis]